jgi:hypothetical protein
MATDGTMRTSQVSCYKSTISTSWRKALRIKAYFSGGLLLSQCQWASLNKQDDKIIHKKPLYAFLFRFTSNERAIFQTIRQSKEATYIFRPGINACASRVGPSSPHHLLAGESFPTIGF